MGNEERVSMEQPQPPADAPGQAAGKTPSDVEGDERAGESQPAAAELTLLLEDARAKADQHWEALLRAKAELENLRKRSRRDIENAHKFGNEKFIAELLPVKDSMELGLSAAGEREAGVEKVREGMELTLKMLQTAMARFGVTELDPEGEKFDPDLHQAMTVQETDTVEPGTVVSVIQKGYLLNDRLLRPALTPICMAIGTAFQTSHEWETRESWLK